MDMKDKRNNFIAIGLIAVLALAGLWYGFDRQDENKKGETVETINTEEVTETIPETVVTTTTTSTAPSKGTVTTKPTTQGLSYQRALAAYPYRIQFVSCHGNPGKLTVKQGSKVMLDNRDERTHTIMVGRNKYSIKGYNFTVVTAPTAGTYNITCDGGGAAQMITQK